MFYRDFPLLRSDSCFESSVVRRGQKFNRLVKERTFVNVLVCSLYNREPKNILQFPQSTGIKHTLVVKQYWRHLETFSGVPHIMLILREKPH